MLFEGNDFFLHGLNRFGQSPDSLLSTGRFFPEPVRQIQHVDGPVDFIIEDGPVDFKAEHGRPPGGIAVVVQAVFDAVLHGAKIAVDGFDSAFAYKRQGIPFGPLLKQADQLDVFIDFLFADIDLVGQVELSDNIEILVEVFR